MAAIESILVEFSSSLALNELYSKPPAWLQYAMFLVFNGLILLPAFIVGLLSNNKSLLLGAIIGILGGILFIAAYYIPVGNDLITLYAISGLVITAAICSVGAYIGQLLRKYLHYKKSLNITSIAGIK